MALELTSPAFKEGPGIWLFDWRVVLQRGGEGWGVRPHGIPPRKG